MADERTSPSLHLVDPELRDMAVQIKAALQGLHPMSQAKLAERRAINAARAPAPSLDVPYERHVVAADRYTSDADVDVYVVNARPDVPGPGLLYIHGGGYNSSSALGSMSDAQIIAAALGRPLVTVDYRIAPEATYRRSVEDNYSALRWVQEEGARFGIDPARIALYGPSAGGGHAALVALTARDRGEVEIFYQMLIYPMLDDRTGTTRATGAHVGEFVWTDELNRFGWECFLGCEPGGEHEHEHAAGVPARAPRLAGLPPTFIGCGTLDLFVDESIDFARRLIEEGVPTELIVVPGAFHGFDMSMRDAAVSRRFNTLKIEALARAFAG